MRPHPAKSVPSTLLACTITCLPLFAVLFAGSALAADDPDSSPAKKDEAPAAAAESETTRTEKGKASEPVQATPPDNSWLPVERLPPASFPEPKPRGIHGGSLWLIFHGLQWPYIPKTGIGISGSAWVDTGLETITRGNNQKNTRFWLQQGRGVIRVTPTYSDGHFFVQAQAELVGNEDQNTVQPNVADTDDLWVRTGVWKSWDVQAGRFEGWELYHLGMGMDLNTLERLGAVEGSSSSNSPPALYGTTFGFYRPSSVGNIALHLYPTDFLRFELLGHAGNDTVTGFNTIGGRPAAILDFGIIRIKAGAEYRVSTPRESDVMMTPVLDANMMPVLNPDGTPMITVTHPAAKAKDTAKGFGGTVQLVLNPYFEAGLNAAQGFVRKIDQMGGLNTAATYTVTTVGGFANARIIEGLIAGVGVHYTTLVDEHLDTTTGNFGFFAHLQSFAAVQYLVSGQLFVKAVFGYARAELEPSFSTLKWHNTMLSGRVRLMYLF